MRGDEEGGRGREGGRDETGGGRVAGFLYVATRIVGISGRMTMCGELGELLVGVQRDLGGGEEKGKREGRERERGREGGGEGREGKERHNEQVN